VAGQRSAALPIVLVASPERDLQARLAQATRGDARLLCVDKFDAVASFISQSADSVAIVLLPVRDGSGMEATALTRRIAAASPRTAIIVHCRAGGEHTSEIRSLAAAGVHQFLFRGIDDYGIALKAVLQAARRQCASECVYRALAPLVPPTLHSMVEAALNAPDAITNVDSLSAALGIHRKTLFNRCERAAFLGPSELLRWVRLALVAYLLETTGCTLERLAIDLAFPSDVSLRNMLKRYTGLRSIDIRRGGGCAVVLDALQVRAAVSQHRDGQPDLHLM